MSPWLIAKPGKRERTRLGGGTGGHNNTTCLCQGMCGRIARRKCPMSHTPLHVCRWGVIQNPPFFFNYLLPLTIGVITGRPRTHSRLLWGKLGSKFLETWWGKGNLLWSIRKREGGAIVVNHGILFAGRRHPYFRLDVLRCSLFLAPLGQKKEEGPQLDF